MTLYETLSMMLVPRLGALSVRESAEVQVAGGPMGDARYEIAPVVRMTA
jgi:hypothetical protein